MLDRSALAQATEDLLGSVQDRIAVDEAHCVSQWGAPQQSHVPFMLCPRRHTNIYC